jgi:hypothetical protein
VDFQSQVLCESGWDLMSWPHLIDEVHLTLRAARLWARVVGDAILADLGTGYPSSEPGESWLEPVLERNQGRRSLSDSTMCHAAGYIQKRMFLIAAIGLREAVALGSSRAESLQECLQVLAGGGVADCQPPLNQQLQDAISICSR